MKHYEFDEVNDDAFFMLDFLISNYIGLRADDGVDFDTIREEEFTLTVGQVKSIVDEIENIKSRLNRLESNIL